MTPVSDQPTNVEPPPLPNTPESAIAESGSLPDQLDPWGLRIPAVLKQPEGHARFSAAVGGMILGVCVAVLCFFVVPHQTILGRMFDLRKAEVIVPISIVAVFFWGMFLCLHRWQRVRACEDASTFKMLTAATDTLNESGIQSLSTQLDHPDSEFSPLFRRLKALVSQWQLKPGLVEADLALQQFVVDDEESTRRAYSLVRTFVWALPVLGLIGTVLGIAFAVGGFANFLGGKVDDVETIKTSLVGVTGGLSFAFLLTLLGLATSLALMLVASSLETREERMLQDIQQRVVGTFLPVLQRVCPAEEAGKSKAELIVDPLKAAADAILNHVSNLAEKNISKLSETLQAQQQQVTTWGQGLQNQASSAAAVVKGSLEYAAKNLRESGGEFLARLDLVRQTWKEQADTLQTALRQQTQTNQNLTTQLQGAAQGQAQASQSLATSLQNMQVALAASATAVQSLDAGLRQLASSPLEQIATALAKSLQDVSRESEKISKTLVTMTDSMTKTAELQTNVHGAVKQLHDLKLVDTLASFRDSLVHHANLVDKLKEGLTIKLSQ
jgi:biopolymer transport protein ExbB/TolQ